MFVPPRGSCSTPSLGTRPSNLRIRRNLLYEDWRRRGHIHEEVIRLKARRAFCGTGTRSGSAMPTAKEGTCFLPESSLTTTSNYSNKLKEYASGKRTITLKEPQNFLAESKTDFIISESVMAALSAGFQIIPRLRSDFTDHTDQTSPHTGKGHTHGLLAELNDLIC